MIYLFSGDDAKNKLVSYEKFIKSMPKGAENFFITRNEFEKTQIENFYASSSLFFTKTVVIFSNILEYEEAREFVLKKLPLIGESSNSFIFLESKLNKPSLDAFRKLGREKAELYLFELPKEKKEKFDNFLVANAFEKKDKLHTWVYFRLAMDKGVGMEELIGVLFWKVKDMLLRKNFRKFTEAELKTSASRLSYLLPEARKKGKDAQSVFEQFLLEVF